MHIGNSGVPLCGVYTVHCRCNIDDVAYSRDKRHQRHEYLSSPKRPLTSQVNPQVTRSAAFQVYLPAWWALSAKDWTPVMLPETADIESFHGQLQQDKYIIENYYHGRKNLFYVEMGGYNGVNMSNTLYLHKALNWKGLLIEANPALYSEMVANRPNDIGVNAATCSSFQEVHFNDAPGVGGIIEFMAGTHKDIHNAALAPANITVIPCIPFSSVLSKLGITHIDLWSLDVEGAELQVLETVDWKAVSVDVIVVEAPGYDEAKDQAVIDLLLSQGFIHDQKITWDNWFHHKSFTPSVSP